MDWQPQMPWPGRRDLQDLKPNSYYCCGTYDPSDRVVGPMLAEDAVGKKLLFSPGAPEEVTATASGKKVHDRASCLQNRRIFPFPTLSTRLRRRPRRLPPRGLVNASTTGSTCVGYPSAGARHNARPPSASANCGGCGAISSTNGGGCGAICLANG